jgi:D-alanyl-D-alanine dipeptidase
MPDTKQKEEPLAIDVPRPKQKAVMVDEGQHQKLVELADKNKIAVREMASVLIDYAHANNFTVTKSYQIEVGE